MKTMAQPPRACFKGSGSRQRSPSWNRRWGYALGRGRGRAEMPLPPRSLKPTYNLPPPACLPKASHGTPSWSTLRPAVHQPLHHLSLKLPPPLFISLLVTILQPIISATRLSPLSLAARPSGATLPGNPSRDKLTHLPPLRLPPRGEWLLENPAQPGSPVSPCHLSTGPQLAHQSAAPTVTLNFPALPPHPSITPTPLSAGGQALHLRRNESPTEGSLHMVPTKSLLLTPVGNDLGSPAEQSGLCPWDPEKRRKSVIRGVSTLTRIGFGTHWLQCGTRISSPEKRIRRNGQTAPEEVVSPLALRDGKSAPERRNRRGSQDKRAWLLRELRRRGTESGRPWANRGLQQLPSMWYRFTRPRGSQ